LQGREKKEKMVFRIVGKNTEKREAPGKVGYLSTGKKGILEGEKKRKRQTLR